MTAEPLTHRELDYLLETYRKGAMLFGSDEHDAFVVAAVEYLPRLVAAVRPTIPGELHTRVFLAGVTPPGLNAQRREHHKARARRVKREREHVALKLHGHNPPALSVVVTMTRCSARLLDDDGAVGSMKAIRDEIAMWFGVDDAHPGITWRVEQRKVPKKEAGTEIRIEARP